MMAQQFIAPSLSFGIGNYMLSSVIWVLLHEEMDRELHEVKPGAILAISECTYTLTLKSMKLPINHILHKMLIDISEQQ